MTLKIIWGQSTRKSKGLTARARAVLTVFMKIRLNGKDFEAAKARNILRLLEEIGANPKRCVVEHNRKALRPADFEGAELSEGDEVEVMAIVAGG